MITIHPSKTADTRTCDVSTVTKAQLLASSIQHIGDVGQALAFFGALMTAAAVRHDTDKLTDIDSFHADFLTKFEQTGWWDRHRQLNRHHLTAPDGVRDDVNLIDVLDFIADCVMAGMGRSGSVYPLHLAPELLERAFQNTVALLKAQVVVTKVHAAQHAADQQEIARLKDDRSVWQSRGDDFDIKHRKLFSQLEAAEALLVQRDAKIAELRKQCAAEYQAFKRVELARESLQSDLIQRDTEIAKVKEERDKKSESADAYYRAWVDIREQLEARIAGKEAKP